jgi:rare lipoprotein A
LIYYHSWIFDIVKKIIYINFFLLVATLFATGCMHPVDRAPSLIFDFSKIPNAIPRYEAISKYGNKSYNVNGKRYFIFKSSQNYHVQGIASWYGVKFHGHKTSNHETYNMFAMTAAHRNLPIPSYLKVTNLKNLRTVIIRVNDRGPFHPSRIIDLSYAAAYKLGIIGNGTTEVALDSIAPYDHHTQIIKKGFFLPVIVVSKLEKAEKLKLILSQYINSPIQIHSLKKLQTKWYKIEIGPIINITEWVKMQKKIKLLVSIIPEFH